VWTVAFLAVVGLYLYRKMRHRTRRLMKRFAGKAARIPEVRLVTFQGRKATVVVDRIQAKIYLRINGLMEDLNGKLFFGEPLEVVVLDDLAPESFRKLLQEPGALYVRDDVFEQPRART
jgi:hypothetical protein